MAFLLGGVTVLLSLPPGLHQRPTQGILSQDIYPSGLLASLPALPTVPCPTLPALTELLCSLDPAPWCRNHETQSGFQISSALLRFLHFLLFSDKSAEPDYESVTCFEIEFSLLFRYDRPTGQETVVPEPSLSLTVPKRIGHAAVGDTWQAPGSLWRQKKQGKQ